MVDSHVVVTNNREIHVPFTQLPPVAILHKTIARYHKQETEIHREHFHHKQDPSYCPFIVMPTSHLPPLYLLVITNLFPFSIIFPFHKCYIKGII